MIRSLDDYRTKPKGEDRIKWFQRTRGLRVTGAANEETRRVLIKEYMGRDGTTLPASVTVTTHGCGEHFPLPPPAQGAEQHSTGHDRRVELFFFDPRFGIQPPPPGPNSAAGSPEYPEWVLRSREVHDLTAAGVDREVELLEVHDALFRTNSCVVLPEGEDPITSSQRHESLTAVGIIATLLRYNEEHPGKKLLIAGHADTMGKVDFNQKLSEERAQVALACLTGDKDTFKNLCHNRHQVSDIKQILRWIHVTRGYPCDPGKINDTPNLWTPVNSFQKAYNADLDNVNPGGARIGVDGDPGPETWGAFFDCYEAALREELGEDAAAVAALRAQLVFLDDSRKSLGFSEHHPIDNLGRDHYRSQANRRVEALMFDPGEEPDLDAGGGDPEMSEVYDPDLYRRAPLEPMVSALPWRATWSEETAHFDCTRTLQLAAPGLPAGVPMTFTVSLVDHGDAGELKAASLPESARAQFDAWDTVEDPPFAGELEADGEFPKVEFEFVVQGGGRRIRSNRCLYSDRLLMKLVASTSNGDVLLANERYVVCSPWGRRKGVTDEHGTLEELGLPPGGASVALRARVLVDHGELVPGWNLDA
jgi:hypothetical protein